MNMNKIIYLIAPFLFVTLASCQKDDRKEINMIGGYYFFINETTKDSIDNYDASKGKILEARNGDALRLMYKSGYAGVGPHYKCQMTFVLPDGSKQIKEGTIDNDIFYDFVLTDTPIGKKTFLVIPELTDKDVICTVGDKIVILKLLVKE